MILMVRSYESETQRRGLVERWKELKLTSSLSFPSTLSDLGRLWSSFGDVCERLLQASEWIVLPG